jgi:hypothetical protein
MAAPPAGVSLVALQMCMLAGVAPFIASADGMRSGAALLPAASPQVSFSPYTWALDPVDRAGGGAAVSAQPGAYLRLGVNGTASVAMRLNTTHAPPHDYMRVSLAVDGGAKLELTVPHRAASSHSTMTLAEGMSAFAPHLVELWIHAATHEPNRWQPSAANFSGLHITHFELDSSGGLLSLLPQPSAAVQYSTPCHEVPCPQSLRVLRPKRCAPKHTVFGPSFFCRATDETPPPVHRESTQAARVRR